MANAVSSLSSYTGLSEAELLAKTQGLIDSSGKIRGLVALDAALISASAGGVSSGTSTIDPTAAATYLPHTLEEPLQTLPYQTSSAGFAEEQSSVAPITSELLDNAAKSGSKKLKAASVAAQAAGDPADNAAAMNSSAMQFEMIKHEMQKMSTAQNAITNVLTAMHNQAMDAIRNAKA